MTLNLIAPSVLISISIGLTASVTYLFVQTHYHFDRSVLLDEKGRVRTIFIVFTLTYLSRAIIYLLTRFVEAKVVNTILIYYWFHPYWDVLPLTLIMVYHRTCYEAQYAELMRLQQEAEEENRESLLTASSA